MKRRKVIKITKVVFDILDYFKAHNTKIFLLKEQPETSKTLIKIYSFHIRFPGCKNTYLQQCIRFALYGNQNSEIGDCFIGVLNSEEKKLYLKFLGRMRADETHQILRETETPRQKHQRTSTAGTARAKLTGCKTFLTAETLFLTRVIKQNKAGYYIFYKHNKKCFHTARIARRLNEKFHKNVLVRNGKIISAKITKLLKIESL